MNRNSGSRLCLYLTHSVVFRMSELWSPGRSDDWVDVLLSLIRAALTFGFMFLIIVLLAGLFMVVFSIATGIDRRMQE